jgi:Protein of unknown function (DUF3237)
MARAFAIDETSETSRSTSCATPLAVALSLMVGVVDDSGAVCVVRCGPAPNQSRRSSVCSGAVNGTTIWTTNQMAMSCERRRATSLVDTRRVPKHARAVSRSYAPLAGDESRQKGSVVSESYVSVERAASCILFFLDTRPLMTLRVQVAAPQTIGAVPHGTRRIAPITGGSFDGPRLRGLVVANASADWLLLRADGVLELDLRATLQTDDGALISMRSFGLRHGPADVIAALGRGEPVDPSRYYFRTTIRFQTAHPSYAFLNRLVAVASGDRRAEGPIYTIDEVL